MNGVDNEKSDLATCCDGTFLTLIVSMKSFLLYYVHHGFYCQVDSIFVTFDYVPLVVFINFLCSFDSFLLL